MKTQVKAFRSHTSVSYILITHWRTPKFILKSPDRVRKGSKSVPLFLIYVYFPQSGSGSDHDITD